MSQETRPLPPDLAGADAALRRAAARALALARQTGTRCWVWRDGKIIDLAAEPEEVADRVAEGPGEPWDPPGKGPGDR